MCLHHLTAPAVVVAALALAAPASAGEVTGNGSATQGPAHANSISRVPAWRTATTTTTASRVTFGPASRPELGTPEVLKGDSAATNAETQGVGLPARRLLQRPPWVPCGWRRARS